MTKRVSAPDVRDVQLVQLYQKMAERNNQLLQRRNVQKVLQLQMKQQRQTGDADPYFSDSGETIFV